jgi:hypothetical protein
MRVPEPEDEAGLHRAREIVQQITRRVDAADNSRFAEGWRCALDEAAHRIDFDLNCLTMKPKEHTR